MNRAVMKIMPLHFYLLPGLETQTQTLEGSVLAEHSLRLHQPLCLLSACSTVCQACAGIPPISPRLRCPAQQSRSYCYLCFPEEEHQVQETPSCLSAFLVLISLLPASLVQQPSGA